MKHIRLLLLSACVLGLAISSRGQGVEMITTFAGGGGSLGDGGPASVAQFNGNYMIATDAAGNLFIADAGNNRIRRIDAVTGIITTVAGIGGTGGYTGDNVAATTVKLNSPIGVAVDAAGSIYIGDDLNNRIRKVDASGTITTIVGTGSAGTSADGTAGTACQITTPRGVWVNSAGDVFFAEGNGGGGPQPTLRIRKLVASSGQVFTVAGVSTAGFSGDGGAATLAQLNSPRGVTVDAAGNVYIADMSNSRIRMVNTSGIISTVAGTTTAGAGTDGIAATASRLNLPTDVKLDAAGNMYIADVSNGRIRMVNPAGIISTVAGNSVGSSAGDWKSAIDPSVRINAPVSIAFLSNPNYYFISDRTGNKIRMVRPNSIPYFVNAVTGGSLTVCENSGTSPFSSQLDVMDSDQVQTLTWSLFSAPSNGTVSGTGTTATANSATAPLSTSGFLYTPNIGFSGTDAFIMKIKDGYDSSFITINVTVNPLPSVAPISGSTFEVCPGGGIALTDATPSGVWAASNSHATVTSGGGVTAVSAGTVDISYTVANTCGATTVIQTVTVNALPNAGTITGASFVCAGANTPMTDPIVGGSWNTTTGNAFISGTGVVTGFTAGPDLISYTVTNTCGSATATSSITVNAAPAVAPIFGGTSVVCEGANITFTDATPSGTWTNTFGNATVAGGIVTGVTAGTDVINYSLSNGCGTTTVTKSVTVNPLPVAGSLSGPNNVCLSDIITLSPTVGGGTWTASNSNATVNSSGDVTGMSAGAVTISYSVTNSCGTAVAPYVVNVVSTPSAGTITGILNVCPTAITSLSDATTGGTWSASNPNATVDASGNVTGVTAGTDVISYTVVASCGTAFATQTVTIDPLANAGVITGSSSVCMGYTTLLSDAIPGGSWSSGSANATVSSSGLVTGMSVGAAIISYGVTNGCGTQYAIYPMTINPNINPSVTFSASPGFTTCPHTLVTYTPIPVNGGSIPTYQWRVNGAMLGTSTTFNYTPADHDTVTVKMTSNAACVAPLNAFDTVVVTVRPTLVPSVNISTGIVGDTVCVGTLAAYSATPTNGGTTPAYAWYVNGTLAAAGNPFVYTPSNGDIITSQMTSSYQCPSPASVMSNTITMTVDVTEDPAVTITASPSSAICSGSTVTFTAHPLYGGIPPFYRWTRNGVNVATGPTYTVAAANGDNIYAMMASSSTCRTTDTVFSNHITASVVMPKPISVTITQNSAVTGVGVADTFHATVVTTAIFPTYQWYKNGTAIAGATGPTYVYIGGIPGTVSITCTAGSGDACYTTAGSNSLTVTTAGVGVQELNANTADLKVAPNPSKGTFSMNLTSAIDEPVTVTITNVLGAKVQEFTTATNTERSVSLGNAAGIYILSAHTEHGKYNAKVVVE